MAAQGYEFYLRVRDTSKFLHIASGQCSSKRMFSSGHIKKPDYKDNVQATIYFKNINS